MKRAKQFFPSTPVLGAPAILVACMIAGLTSCNAEYERQKSDPQETNEYMEPPQTQPGTTDDTNAGDTSLADTAALP